MKNKKYIEDAATVPSQESWGADCGIFADEPSNAVITEKELFTCAFTGHRSILPEDRLELSDRLSHMVEYLYARGCRVFYCGGALGFDTLAAREVIKLSMKRSGVKLRLILPCQNQDSKWSEGQRDSYFYILKNAELVEYISDEYTPTCMKERNQRLSELGDVLVAYLYRQKSGAGQTVRMATRLGKMVYNLAPRGMD